MFLQEIKENYKITNEALTKILKCSSKRIEKLLNYDAEITTTEMVRLCDSLNLWNDARLSQMFKQAVYDNDKYRLKHNKRVREKYSSEK